MDKVKYVKTVIKVFTLSFSTFLIVLLNWLVLKSWIIGDKVWIDSSKYGEGIYEYMLINVVIMFLVFMIFEELVDIGRK